MSRLKNEFLTATFNEVGAELKSLIFGGREYIWEGRSEVWAGSCPLLFPICGGLKAINTYLTVRNTPLKSTDMPVLQPLRLRIRPTARLCFYINRTLIQRKAFPLIMN